MCLIAYSPKGAMVDRSILAYAYNQNPDGIGIMSVSGIEKFMGRKALKRARRYLESYLVPEETPYAIHFRWATHGAIQMSNTHPYEAPTGLHWVMHNGVINLTASEATKDESDTAVFVRKYMTDIPAFDDKAYFTALGYKIGWSNKLCIMDSNGDFILCNDDAGTWIDGIWFSNTYSLPAHKIPTRVCGGHAYDANGYDGYYSRATRPYVPKEVWDAQERKMVPNPAYKAADADYKPIVEIGRERIETASGNVYLLPRPRKEENEDWNAEDRRAYYEALEQGLTPTEDSEYYDAGPLGKDAAVMEPHEIALRLAEAEGMAAKEEADIGGDFAPEEDSDEQSNFRKYLKRVAAGIYSS